MATRQVILIAVVEVLALSCWYSVSAAAPQLTVRWHLTGSRTAWLASTVLIGFSAGALALALLRIPDRVRPQRLLPLGALLAAAATAAPALLPLGYTAALTTRVVTGAALAAVYPPGMRVVTSWTQRRRGTAVALIVAALAVGSALPHAARELPLPGSRPILLTAAAAAVLAAALAVGCRLGPRATPSGVLYPRAVLGLFTDPRQRLTTIAYLGHMWEVYGVWTWTPALLALLTAPPTGMAHLLLEPDWGTFLLIGGGGTIGCLAAGWAADHWGRPEVAATAVALSTCCCLASPLIPALPAPAAAAVLIAWGVAVLADSPLYSALLADAAPPDTVGTALTTQMALGYALAVVPVLAVPLIADAVGWRWAFLALAPGPAVSTAALLALRRRPGKPIQPVLTADVARP